MKKYTRDTGSFIGKGGTEIFFQSWTVGSPGMLLFIAHGHGEHSGRYMNIIRALEGKGISIYALDHRGHGKSGGRRGHAMSFMDYVYDLKVFIDHVREDRETIPVILLGHSMGGAIAMRYTLNYPDDLTGLILSSALMYARVEVPGWKKALGRFFSKYIPGLTMSTGLSASGLSHDSYVIDAYENDPLVHDLASSRWYTEMLANTDECVSRAGEITMPLLVFHGGSDSIVDPAGSTQIFNLSSSKKKEIHIYEGLYHETMNETDREKEAVLSMVTRWIEKLVPAKKVGNPAAKKKISGKAVVKKPAEKKTVKKAEKKKPSKKTYGKTAVKKKKK